MKTIYFVFFVISILMFACTEKKETAHRETNSFTAETTEHQFYGYVSTISEIENFVFISVDTIQYYIGAEAQKQFELDNDLSEAAFDNTFYIRNLKEECVDMKLSDKVEIITQTFSFDESGMFEINKKITLAEFVSFLKSDDWNRFNYIPFELVLRNDRVIKIKEIYIP